MYELALFAGVGGGMLGGKLLGWRTVGAVEYEGYCREVILRRQADGMLPLFPVWDDVCTFRKDNEETRAYIKAVGELAPLVVTAGFPCQPYSVAGKGAGKDDERNLWPETIRIIREVGPEVVLLENVPGLLTFDYFGKVLGDLADAGYDAEWEVVSAGQCGAPHLRRRLWILAHSRELRRNSGRAEQSLRRVGKHSQTREELADAEGDGWGDRQSVEGQGSDGGVRVRSDAGVGSEAWKEINWWGVDPADAFRIGFQQRGAVKEAGRESGIVVEGSHRDVGEPAENVAKIERQFLDQRGIRRNPWGIESGLGRVAHGVANRVDRLKSIGNGQVAIVAAVAFCRLASAAGLDLRRYVPALFQESIGESKC